MKAQIIHAFGPPDVFELTTVADPTPQYGQVLVRQQATSINPVDYKVRESDTGLAPPFPAILGSDVSGVVTAVGEGVTDFQVGDEVYGAVGGIGSHDGAYAELMAVEARLLAKRPAKLSPKDAAALPLVTITAWEGLDRAQVSSGDKVLVRGGTGGVGHIVIQLAKARGAHVVATVSSEEKAKIAKELGADETINYKTEDFQVAVDRITDKVGFDAVFDATGGSDLETDFQAARLNGHVVTIVSLFQADLSTAHLRGLSLHVVFMLIPMLHGTGGLAHRKILEAAAELVDAGKLRPNVDPTPFQLKDMADAHRRAESGKVMGKVVVQIAD